MIGYIPNPVKTVPFNLDVLLNCHKQPKWINSYNTYSPIHNAFMFLRTNYIYNPVIYPLLLPHTQGSFIIIPPRYMHLMIYNISDAPAYNFGDIFLLESMMSNTPKGHFCYPFFNIESYYPVIRVNVIDARSYFYYGDLTTIYKSFYKHLYYFDYNSGDTLGIFYNMYNDPSFYIHENEEERYINSRSNVGTIVFMLYYTGVCSWAFMGLPPVTPPTPEITLTFARFVIGGKLTAKLILLNYFKEVDM